MYANKYEFLNFVKTEIAIPENFSDVEKRITKKLQK